MVTGNGSRKWREELGPRASEVAQWLEVLPSHRPDSVCWSPGPHSRRTELSLTGSPSALQWCTAAQAPTLCHTRHLHTPTTHFKGKLGSKRTSRADGEQQGPPDEYQEGRAETQLGLRLQNGGLDVVFVGGDT